MPDVDLPFSRAEYAARIARARTAMEASGVELMLVTDPSNMAWLTAYDGWSFYAHQCVLLTLHEEPVWYGRRQDANGALRTVHMDAAHILSYPDEYVQSRERHPMDHLSAVIADRSWGRLRIGVEMDNYYYSAAAHASLVRHLPGARMVDATGLVNRCRAVKSECELTYMRRAGRIVEAMHARIYDKVEPGMRKHDLVAEIYDAGVRGVDGHGGDYPAIVPLLPSGRDAAAPHLTWDDREMQAGEGTFFEIAGCHRRYHCPLSRTVYLGRPPAAVLEADQAVREGLAAGLEMARAGNTCEDIALAFFAVLARFGITKDSRAGYAIGMSYPPDWGERTMSLRPGDRSVLEAGMTFHFMPGLWMDDWGLETTESIVITDGAPECLASVPRELRIKE